MFFRGNGVILKTNDRQIGEHIFKIDEVGPRLIYLRFRGKKKTLRHLKCPEKTSNVLKCPEILTNVFKCLQMS